MNLLKGSLLSLICTLIFLTSSINAIAAGSEEYLPSLLYTFSNISLCSEEYEAGCPSSQLLTSQYDFNKNINTLLDDYCIDVPVLLYHHIEPLEQAKKEGHEKFTVDSIWFSNHLLYLKENNYTTLFADELVEALRLRKALPEKSVLITIDDGYKDLYTYAFQFAKKNGIKINAMISTDLVGKKGYVETTDLLTMRDSGFVGFYNHTHTHYALSHGSEEKIQNEVLTANQFLSDTLGINNNILTYPYGDFDYKVITILQNQNIKGAFTTIHGRTQCLSEIYKLRRDHIGNANLSNYGL